MTLPALLFLFALMLLLFSGIAAAVCRARETAARRMGAISTPLAGLLAAPAVVQGLFFAEPIFIDLSLALPYGSFTLAVDALSAFFLLIIFTIASLAAIYGAGYLGREGTVTARGVSTFWFNLLVLGMALVATAANGLLFIIAWEIMSLSAFFLVTFEDEKPQTQKAGLIYLIAAHIGVVFLFLMFWLFAGKTGGSMDFIHFGRIIFADQKTQSLLFLLSLIGFGAKAGFVPLHVWLPEAHPAAPSHVSALMSGVMIKMGLYGLLRTLSWLTMPPYWWGAVLVTVGLITGLLGVLFALAQHDLKRLLAYHSVENIGIMAIGLGLGVLGVNLQENTLIVFGFGGCILHVFNHSIFKSLLFMAAGAVKQQLHTLEIDQLGGLQKRMPVTAAAFLIGAAAISGLPLLNGFVSELMIYFASFSAVASEAKRATALPLMSLLGLAAIGGLAVACFTKAMGVIFLGEARTAVGANAADPAAGMRIPIVILTALCILLGLAPILVLPLLKPVLAATTPLASAAITAELMKIAQPLIYLSLVAVTVAGVFLLLWWLRRRPLAVQGVQKSGTWDCGYLEPDSRMQYTASSFVQPVIDQTNWLLRTQTVKETPQGFFPETGKYISHTPDMFIEKGYRPLFAAIAWLFHQLQWMQRGRISLYILYIAVALLALLFWFGGLR